MNIVYVMIGIHSILHSTDKDDIMFISYYARPHVFKYTYELCLAVIEEI